MRFFRSLVAAFALLAFVAGPALAGGFLVQRPHTTSEKITEPEEGLMGGGFSAVHTSTGASGAIDLDFPDCTASTLGFVFLVAATDQAVSLVPGSGDEFILNGTGITAGDEVDLAVGEFAIAVCTVAGKVYVESAGGADGGSAD